LSSNPGDSIYIGDTTTDLRTAKAAKVPFIGYLGNTRWAKRLEEEGIDTCISDLLELKKLVKKV
jgi:phosphoglycolate phosphatase-like HAD superfamily hydrolase